MIKAIETRYAGCRFRSRLEARWAVFFDSAKIDWRYEPEGFQLPSGWYLPDFYLPGLDTVHYGRGAWMEVKGKYSTLQEEISALELRRATGKPVYIADGDIPRQRTCGCRDPKTGNTRGSLMLEFVREAPDDMPEMRGVWADRDCFYHGDDVEIHLTAARSARFEHGEHG